MRALRRFTRSSLHLLKMSAREIERMVEDFFGVPISLGSVSNLEQLASEALSSSERRPTERPSRVQWVCPRR